MKIANTLDAYPTGRLNPVLSENTGSRKNMHLQAAVYELFKKNFRIFLKNICIAILKVYFCQTEKHGGFSSVG